MMRWPAFLALALSIVALASTHSTSIAGEPRAHDGFLLRLSAGGGAANTQIEAPLAEFDISGVSGDWNIAIGGAVTPNLALHGTLWGWAMSEPDVDFNTIIGSGTTVIDGMVSMGSIGGGLTYYFMPVNMYLSGSVGMGVLSVDGDNLDLSTDSGLALDLTLGKEWWVGDAWGLGLAGGFSYHSLPDDDTEEDWSGTSFALRFSATLN